jgi:hypothetical protein
VRLVDTCPYLFTDFSFDALDGKYYHSLKTIRDGNQAVDEAEFG